MRLGWEVLSPLSLEAVQAQKKSLESRGTKGCRGAWSRRPEAGIPSLPRFTKSFLLGPEGAVKSHQGAALVSVQRELGLKRYHTDMMAVCLEAKRLIYPWRCSSLKAESQALWEAQTVLGTSFLIGRVSTSPFFQSLLCGSLSLFLFPESLGCATDHVSQRHCLLSLSIAALV